MSKKAKNKSKIESQIGQYHHRLELIRTLIPIIMVTMQAVIMYQLFFKHPGQNCSINSNINVSDEQTQPKDNRNQGDKLTLY